MSELLYDLLHSFGAGIAFAIGVFCGALMMRWTATEAGKEQRETNKRCEDRLVGYVEEMRRVADATEELARKSR